MNPTWAQALLPVQHVTLYIVVGLVLAGLVRLLLAGPLTRFTSRTRTNLDSALLRVSLNPATLLVLLTSLRLASARLEQDVGRISLVNWVNRGLTVLTVIMITHWADAIFTTLVNAYLKYVAARTHSRVDDEFLPLMRKLGRIAIWFLGATLALSALGANITGLIATAGVASLAVALAAQDTLSNMFAGLMIMIDRPFREGDRIQVGTDIAGDVLSVGLRSTRVLTFDNTVIVVPNKDMANSRVVNQVFPDPSVTVRIKLGVAYGSDLKHVKAVLEDIVKAHPKVLQQPSPAVYFTDFGNSALNLLVWCKVADYHDQFKVTDELNMAIYERLTREGIEIPFPQQDVHLHGLAALAEALRGQGAALAKEEAAPEREPLA